jgi:hypothetical protein
MNLDNVSIVIRPRNSWEAIDLGFMLAKKWIGKLWCLWLVTGLVAGAVSLILFCGAPAFALLFFWWLKPLYEPFLLYWLSRAVFGEMLLFPAVIKNWRQIILPGLFASLTVQRFSPERSFLMPVRVLEGVTDDAQKQRKAILTRNQSGALWLSIACFAIELLLTVSGIALIYILIPEEVRRTLEYSSPFTFYRLNIVVYMLVVSFVSPLYIAGGFMLYISRRVDLEAWDIEIGFKNMAARVVEKSERRFSKTFTAVFVLLTLFFSSNLSSLQAANIPPPDECKQILQQVLDGDKFGEKKIIYSWELIDKEKEEEDLSWFSKFFEAFFKRIGEMFSGSYDTFKKWTNGLGIVFEILLWLLLGGGLAWLLYRYPRLRHLFARSANGNSQLKKPEPVLFGMAVTPDSLPADIAAECRKLFQAGETRKVLALLYRGTLSRLLHSHDLRVPDSSTEMECDQLVKELRPENEALFFHSLTCSWLNTAYGHFEPVSNLVQDLIDQWSQLYGWSDES